MDTILTNSNVRIFQYGENVFNSNTHIKFKLKLVINEKFTVRKTDLDGFICSEKTIRNYYSTEFINYTLKFDRYDSEDENSIFVIEE